MSALTIAQLVSGIIIIALVLIQDRSSGLGPLGAGGTEIYQRRRGLERLIFGLTIVMIGLFALLSILNLVV
jgi:preprotein translocase subunit SecG